MSEKDCFSDIFLISLKSIILRFVRSTDGFGKRSIDRRNRRRCSGNEEEEQYEKTAFDNDGGTVDDRLASDEG